MVRAEGNLCFGLTDAGGVILRGICFIALAVLIIPAFGVLSVLIAVMLVAFVVGLVLRPRIRVTGHLPERIVAGQTAHLTYVLTNQGRFPAYHLRVRFRALPEAMEQVGDARLVEHLGSGETTEVVVAIRPQRRGCYQIRPPVCESSFPFNLFRFGTWQEGQEKLIVLPAFSLLDIALPYVSRHVTISSARPAGRTGTSPEYIGNRPFQPGDPPRRIDVRAWARLAAPATKEYDDDLDNYAALVLDTRVPAGGRQSKPRETREFEAAVSLCASMAYTIHNDCMIDLLLAGADLHSFASLPRTIHLDRIHETLAAVEPSSDYAAEQIGALWEDRLGEISEVVFILLDWDRTYQQLAELAEQAGCHCTVIVVGEPAGGRGNPLGLPDTARAGTGACPYTDIRFVSADDVLARRRDPL